MCDSDGNSYWWVHHLNNGAIVTSRTTVYLFRGFLFQEFVYGLLVVHFGPAKSVYSPFESIISWFSDVLVFHHFGWTTIGARMMYNVSIYIEVKHSFVCKNYIVSSACIFCICRDVIGKQRFFITQYSTYLQVQYFSRKKEVVADCFE